MTNLYRATAHGEFNISLPRPEVIPDEKIAAALAKFIEIRDRETRLQQERNAAEVGWKRAIEEDIRRGTEADVAGEEDPDPLLLQKPAKLAYEELKVRADSARNARRVVYGELRGTINAHREEWKVAAREKVEAAAKRATAALRTVETARQDFESHLGVLELLARPDVDHLSASWSLGSVEAGIAVENLEILIGKVSKAVREL